MIEQARRRENEEFGQEIVQLAMNKKDKRDKSKPKRNFTAEHKADMKNWKKKQDDE